MKDFWLIDVLERKEIQAQFSVWKSRWRRHLGKNAASSIPTESVQTENDNQLLAEYSEVRESFKKTGDLAWDDEDYWHSLESKIMAKVETASMRESEDKAWAPWEKPKEKMKLSTLPFLALLMCSLLVSTGAVVARPNSQPDFSWQMSESSEKIEDSQFVLMHQDPTDFLMDVAARRSDSIDKKVVQ
jgi:hypothetical protein